MRMLRSLFIALSITGTACSTGREAAPSDSTSVGTERAADPVAIRAVIDSANARTDKAIERGDSVGAFAAFAENAVVMWQDQDAWRGADQIKRGMLSALSGVKLKERKVNIDDIMTGGDLAVVTGTYDWTVTLPNGSNHTEKGKYVDVWQRQADGSWKVVRDISNSNPVEKRQ